VDEEFFPPLSSRKSGIEERVDKVLYGEMSGYHIIDEYPLNESGPGITSNMAGGKDRCLAGVVGIEMLDCEELNLEMDDDKNEGHIEYMDNNYNSPHKLGYINMLAILPAYRKRGLGTTLINKAELLLKTIGAEEVMVCTWSTNDAALNLYKSIGYRIK